MIAPSWGNLGCTHRVTPGRFAGQFDLNVLIIDQRNFTFKQERGFTKGNSASCAHGVVLRVVFLCLFVLFRFVLFVLWCVFVFFVNHACVFGHFARLGMASPSSRSFFLPSVIRVLLFFLLARLGLASSLPRCLSFSSSSSSCCLFARAPRSPRAVWLAFFVPYRCFIALFLMAPLRDSTPSSSSIGFVLVILWAGCVALNTHTIPPSFSPSLFSFPFLLFPSPSLLLLSLRFSFFPGGMRRPPAPFFLLPPGRLRRPKYAFSLSLSLSVFLSLSLSLSLSLFLSFVPFLFFFFPSLGYFLYFLFARLGMACSSSASSPSRPLSSTRSRLFCAVWGCCPRRP